MEKDPQCDLFTSFGKFKFTTLTEAVDFAMSRGKEEAIASARASGARDIVVEVKKKDMKVGIFGEGYGDNVFLGTEIIIIATGRPA